MLVFAVGQVFYRFPEKSLRRKKASVPRVKAASSAGPLDPRSAIRANIF